MQKIRQYGGSEQESTDDLRIKNWTRQVDIKFNQNISAILIG